MPNIQKFSPEPPAGALALPAGSRPGAWLPKVTANREQRQLIEAAASADLFAGLTLGSAGKQVSAALTRAVVRLGHKNTLVKEEDLLNLSADVLGRIRSRYPRMTVPEFELVLQMGVAGDFATEENDFAGLTFNNICGWLRKYFEHEKPAALLEAVPPLVEQPQAPPSCELPPEHPVEWCRFALNLAQVRLEPEKAPLFFLPMFIRHTCEQLLRLGLIEQAEFEAVFSEKALLQFNHTAAGAEHPQTFRKFRKAISETGEAPPDNLFTERAYASASEVVVKRYINSKQAIEVYYDILKAASSYVLKHTLYQWNFPPLSETI